MMRITRNRIISIVLAVMMGLSMSACGKAKEEMKMTTEELSTEEEVGIWVNEPDQEIDPGVNITEAEPVEEIEPVEEYEPVGVSELPDSLTAFLNQFICGPHIYDCTSEEDQYKMLCSIMSSEIPCVNLYAYPIISPEHPEEGVTDKLKEWSASYFSCIKVAYESIRWVAVNIFNIDEANLEKFGKRAEEEKLFYIDEDGSFVTGQVGVGDPFIHAEVIYAEKLGDRYRITYNVIFKAYDEEAENRGTYEAEMELKTIEGEQFWSIYSQHEGDPDAGNAYSDSNDPSVIEVPISSSPTHYEDDIISFDLPAGVGYKWYARMGNTSECIMCYAMPDDYVKGMLLELNQGAEQEIKDGLCNEPYSLITFVTDKQYDLEFSYNDDIPDAKTAADITYEDLMITGYKKSDTEDIGCAGMFTTTIDGQSAYVVWRRTLDDLEDFKVVLYQCFIDSPKGTIVEIDYSYVGEGFKAMREEILTSVRLK